MRDSNDDDTDQAYRAALAATERDTAALRRKHAVLHAVRASSAERATDVRRADTRPGAVAPDDRPAANEAWWGLSAGWLRGATAASLIGASALVVMHVLEDPGMERASDRSAPGSETAEPARPVAAPAPSLAAPVAGHPPAAGARESLDDLVTSQSVAPRPAVPASPLARSIPSHAASPATAEPTLRASADRMVEPPSRGSVPDTRPMAAVEAARAAPASTTSLSALRQAAPPQSFPPGAESRASAPMPPAAEGSTKAAAEAPAGALGSQTPVRPIQAPAPPALAAMAPPAQPGALLAATAAGDIEAVRRLLQTRGPDEERDADGRTALALAVLRSDVRLVRLLLEKGANRLAPDRLGQTPLGHAQAGGDAALLRALGAP